MEQKTITLRLGSVHGIEIAAVKNEEGQIYVPIKPICEALGVDFPSQYVKIKEDEIFSSTVVLSPMVGADGKNRNCRVQRQCRV